jgi:hypothetical protein
MIETRPQKAVAEGDDLGGHEAVQDLIQPRSAPAATIRVGND